MFNNILPSSSVEQSRKQWMPTSVLCWQRVVSVLYEQFSNVLSEPEQSTSFNHMEPWPLLTWDAGILIPELQKKMKYIWRKIFITLRSRIFSAKFFRFIVEYMTMNINRCGIQSPLDKTKNYKFSWQYDIHNNTKKDPSMQSLIKKIPGHDKFSTIQAKKLKVWFGYYSMKQYLTWKVCLCSPD